MCGGLPFNRAQAAFTLVTQFVSGGWSRVSVSASGSSDQESNVLWLALQILKVLFLSQGAEHFAEHAHGITHAGIFSIYFEARASAGGVGARWVVVLNVHSSIVTKRSLVRIVLAMHNFRRALVHESVEHTFQGIQVLKLWGFLWEMSASICVQVITEGLRVVHRRASIAGTVLSIVFIYAVIVWRDCLSFVSHLDEFNQKVIKL